jgi:hypothetical protein
MLGEAPQNGELPRSGLVQYMFCDPDILRHDSGGSSEGATSGTVATSALLRSTDIVSSIDYV